MTDYEFAKDGWNVVHSHKHSNRQYFYRVIGTLKSAMDTEREILESGESKVFHENFNVGYCLLTRRENNG